ncbi:MAG: hypothetical protein R3F59_31905 [Myxococcota bacterium]
MKLTLRRLMGLGGVLLAVLVLLAWFLWPAAPKQGPRVAKVDTEPPVAPAEQIPARDVLEARKDGDILERLGIDPEITPHCAVINQWNERHVPMWVILDNMDAGGMKFHNLELNCLTTSPLPPGILTWAENHIDYRVNEQLADMDQ